VGGGAGEEDLLAQAVANSLAKAEELGMHGIAMPAISSGIFGFPKEWCAEIMVKSALDFYQKQAQTSLQEIRFTNIDELTTEIFNHVLRNFKKK
jgi:putative ATPase